LLAHEILNGWVNGNKKKKLEMGLWGIGTVYFKYYANGSGRRKGDIKIDRQGKWNSLPEVFPEKDEGHCHLCT